MVAIPINGETWAICGGRSFSDRSMFDSAMLDITQLRGCPSRIIEGGARGADYMAFEWATRMAVPVVEVYANWDAHGKAAGPIRNQKIIDAHRPAVLIAFPGGNGTADMVNRARTAGIDVIEIKAAKAEGRG